MHLIYTSINMMTRSSITQKLTETECTYSFLPLFVFHFIFPERLAAVLSHSSAASSPQYYNALPLKFNLAIYGAPLCANTRFKNDLNSETVKSNKTSDNHILWNVQNKPRQSEMP